MIVAITGDIGSGKTLLMTAISYNDFIIEKRVIYSNYKLNYKHVWLNVNEITNLFSEGMQFRDKTGNMLHKVSFLVDEMHIFLDSRGSGSSLKNKLITYWILQTRKRGIDLFYTTQFFGQVDKRLRNLVDYKIECQNLGTEKNPYFYYSLYKRIAVESLIEFVKIRDFALNNFQNYYKLYDSYEIINPFIDNTVKKVKKEQLDIA
jgi:hypothetical protein